MTTMEFNVKESLCMIKGDGDKSYAKNSSYVQSFVARTMLLMEKVTQSFFVNHDISSYKTVNIADLGCSTGPNSFQMMSTVLSTISNNCNELNLPTPEIQFHLNDLPSNDFNTLFKGLTTFHDDVSFFVSAVPGSFYGLFPSNTLHLVHSSFAVHWLSKIPKIVSDQGLPLNNGNIYITKSSPNAVKEAYLSQFEQDFSLFLKCRSDEIVPNGLMFLTLSGRGTEDLAADVPIIYWHEILTRGITELVKEGLIDEEKLDDFNTPIYPPIEAEVRELVEKEGSFTVVELETIMTEMLGAGVWPGPEGMAKLNRSVTEPIIAAQFGEDLMDKLYGRVSEIIASDWEQGCYGLTRSAGVVVGLRRNKH